jgi:hypothetical protein
VGGRPANLVSPGIQCMVSRPGKGTKLQHLGTYRQTEGATSGSPGVAHHCHGMPANAGAGSEEPASDSAGASDDSSQEHDHRRPVLRAHVIHPTARTLLIAAGCAVLACLVITMLLASWAQRSGAPLDTNKHLSPAAALYSARSAGTSDGAGVSNTSGTAGVGSGTVRVVLPTAGADPEAHLSQPLLQH